jgi:hypothetical protein
MAEILGSGALVAVPAYWAARRILGPTFDQIGDDLRTRYSESRLRNTQRIFEAANRKVDAVGPPVGSIPPRVVMKVLEEGSWCDSQIVAEYFGGILASSPSNDELDDRGSSWTSLLGRLATRDIHLHYLCYSALRETFNGSTELRLGMSVDQIKAQLYVPASKVLDAMQLEHSSRSFERHVVESLLSLSREDLIGEQYLIGKPELFLSELGISVPEDGFLFTPSTSGVRLFYWAHGLGDADINSILKPGNAFEVDPIIPLIDGARSVSLIRAEQSNRSSQD